MNYADTIKYIDSFINYEKIPDPERTRFFKLDRVSFLLEHLDNPHLKFKTVHIAGTKAKGSTCAFIYSILRQAGFKTALYTSPHLIDFRERIVIDGERIGKDDLCSLIGRIKAVIDKNKNKLSDLTFFEIYTALAFLYFAKENVDIAVIETGLGGRFDATNVLKPLACAITPISYDHTKILGNSLSSIAREKVGIIKSDIPVAVAPQERGVLKIIRDVCKKFNAPLYYIGKDLKFGIKNLSVSGSTFDATGISGYKYRNLRIPLIGSHQVVNATVALAVIELLRDNGLGIGHRDISSGLRKVSWPGRLQILKKRPFVVVDGAHNEASAQVLKDAIKKLFSFKRLILILGISANKNVNATGRTLCPLADRVIFTKADNPRAIDPFVLKRRLAKFCRTSEHPVSTFKEAIGRAISIAKPDDLILVSGSLYLVGEALKSIKHKGKC